MPETWRIESKSIRQYPVGAEKDDPLYTYGACLAVKDGKDQKYEIVIFVNRILAVSAEMDNRQPNPLPRNINWCDIKESRAAFAHLAVFGIKKSVQAGEELPRRKKFHFTTADADIQALTADQQAYYEEKLAKGVDVEFTVERPKPSMGFRKE